VKQWLAFGEAQQDKKRSLHHVTATEHIQEAHVYVNLALAVSDAEENSRLVGTFVGASIHVGHDAFHAA
jgi:hypothetical protein